MVNCVGILTESGRNTFDAVQEFGAKAIAEAARDAGATLTHISAIGAEASSSTGYGRTKGRAEAAIHSVLPAAVILRPSIDLIHALGGQSFMTGTDAAMFSALGERAQFFNVSHGSITA